LSFSDYALSAQFMCKDNTCHLVIFFAVYVEVRDCDVEMIVVRVRVTLLDVRKELDLKKMSHV
jgi:hypothetical protein